VRYSPGSVLPPDEQDGQIQSEEQQGENGSTRNPTTLPRVTLSDFTTFWSCDGPCTTSTYKYRELHFCRICNNTCFCEECILLLKGNKLPYRYCNPDHEWIQGLPAPKEMNDLAAASIRDGYVELHQEWLAKLREQWSE
jgi:hypothetical protein